MRAPLLRSLPGCVACLQATFGAVRSRGGAGFSVDAMVPIQHCTTPSHPPAVPLSNDTPLQPSLSLYLQERAAARGIEPGMIVEKQELIQQLSAQDKDNSSACACAVCSEDYESGDVLRVLRCGHKFHIECVDRWLLACDFSRPPACPM